MGLREDLDALVKKMDEKSVPKQTYWLWPPLVREAKPDSEWHKDPRYLAWNGREHPDQTEFEIALREKVKSEGFAP